MKPNKHFKDKFKRETKNVYEICGVHEEKRLNEDLPEGPDTKIEEVVPIETDSPEKPDEPADSEPTGLQDSYEAKANIGKDKA